MTDLSSAHGEPRLIAAVSAVILVGLFTFIWAVKMFGPHPLARRQAIAFADAVVVGASLDDLRAATRPSAYDELSFTEAFVSGAASGGGLSCGATLFVAKTPYEWGARNLQVLAVVEAGRVTGVVFRGGDGVHARAANGPADRDQAIGACVRGALAAW